MAAVEEKLSSQIEMVGGDEQAASFPEFEVCAGCKDWFSTKLFRRTCVYIRAEVMNTNEWLCFHYEFCVVR